MAVPAQPDLIGCGETIGLQILILTAGGPEQKLEAPECFRCNYLAHIHVICGGHEAGDIGAVSRPFS